MGGHIATEVAMRYPDRVSALVLIGAAGLPDETATSTPLSMRVLRWPVIGPLVRRLPARDRVRERLRYNVYDPEIVTEADVDAYYAPLHSAGGTNAFLARMGRRVPPDRADRVRTIHEPTLVITGDSDRVVPPAIARRYHELIPGSELLVMEQTGHLPQEEHPKETASAIIRWIETHKEGQRDTHPSHEGPRRRKGGA
jgi:pimeloyl-ACP methyl ester carboxylesterase